MLARSASVEFVPSMSEREALLLEASLVKQYQPPYNTLLKDDRSFPYLAVTLDEEYPRVLVVRRPRRGGRTALFGPYPSAREARGLAKLLSETFRLRQCVKLPRTACLYYHMGTCTAPCIGVVDAAGYGAQVGEAVRALREGGAELRRSVARSMHEAVGAEEFERAAALRDALGALASLSERQRVVGPGEGRVDVLALAYPSDPASLRIAVGLLRVEDGEVRRTEPHLLVIPADDAPDAGEALRQFLSQYYGTQLDPPDRIYVKGPRPDGLEETDEWLSGEQGIELRFHPTGRYASFANLAERLARAHVDSVTPRPAPREVLSALQSLLLLPTIPNRIEGVDISTFQGSHAVGSLVVFVRGAPAKAEYRRFRIRTVEGTNDFAMVREVVRRRYARLLAESAPLPDLLLIDGGAGQLSAAEEALAEVGLAERVPAIGLAKRLEEVYRIDRSEPMRPNPNLPAMLLLRAVRDEAHRFAVSYHRVRRRMRLTEDVEAASA